MLSWVSFSGHVAKQQRQRSAKALDVGATPTMASNFLNLVIETDMLEKVIRLLPSKWRWKFFSPKGIVRISSTRPGELASNPDLTRLQGLLGSFIAGQEEKSPGSKLVSGEILLDTGWLHPAKSLAALEKKKGCQIAGLEWVDLSLRGSSVSWCGPEMKHSPVRAIFAVPEN